MTGALLSLLAPLLATAFACGLNLYATVAVLGAASRLGWIDPLPITLAGLESPLVIGSAIALYILEFVADKIAHIDSAWDAIHTIIRPTAAALLVFAALVGLSLEWRLAGGIAGGLTALTAHGAKSGLRIVLNASPRRAAATITSLVEDVLAIVLVLLASISPAATVGTAVGVLLLAAIFARPLWRAFSLGLRALPARLRGFFGNPRWHARDELPAAVRAIIDPPPIGRPPPRVTRAALKGIRAVGDYRNGWLVVTPKSASFAYRSLFGARLIELPPARSARTRTGPWADMIEVEAEGGATYALFLLKDGPPTELATAELGTVRS